MAGTLAAARAALKAFQKAVYWAVRLDFYLAAAMAE